MTSKIEKPVYMLGDQERPTFFISKEDQELFGNDKVFQKIIDATKMGWGSLNEKQRTEVLGLISGLIEKLREYHESYVGLKSLGSRKFFVQDAEDREKYQRASENSDKRERALHNAFIDTLNILSRKMKAMGLDNSWRADEDIYGIIPQAAREKPKLWMLKMFKEEIPKPLGP